MCCKYNVAVQTSSLIKLPRSLPSQSLKNLVCALLEQLPEESSPVVIVVKPDRPPLTPTKSNGHRVSQGPVYDPAIVFVLELATVLAMRDTESIAAVGEAVADALHTIVRNATKAHPVVFSRAVFYLLHVLNASQVTSSKFIQPYSQTHMST